MENEQFKPRSENTLLRRSDVEESLTSIRDFERRTVEYSINMRSEQQENLVKAFLEANPTLTPADCVLVEERRGFQTLWWIEAKQK